MKTKMLALATLLAMIFFSFTAPEKVTNKEKGFLFTVSNQQLVDQVQFGFSNLIDKVNSIEVYNTEKLGAYYLVEGSKNLKAISFKLQVSQLEIESSTYTNISFEDLTLARSQGAFEVYCYLIGTSQCSHLYPPTNPICGVKSQNCRFVD